MQNHLPRKQRLILISPGITIVVTFFALGICLSEKLRLNDRSTFSLIFFLFGLIFIWYRFTPRKFYLFFYALIGILFFLIGHHSILINSIPPPDPCHIYNQITEPRIITLYGFLTKYPAVSNSSPEPKTRFTMKVETIYPNPTSLSSHSGNRKSSGLVLLTLNGLLPAGLKPGDHLLAKADVSRVHTFSTPGAFNYKNHLRNKSIFIKGWIASPANIVKVNAVRPQSIISGALMYSFPQLIRSNIAAFINEKLPQPAKGLYKAILIGDRSDINPAVLENFTASGCIHILAVSGMHMGLLAFIFIAVLTWLLKRSPWIMLQVNVFKVAALLSLIPLTLYAYVAGMNLPVLRALLMTSVFILAIMFDRPGNLINHILLAALLILAWNPATIFTASFQLSFSAVIAIALVCPLFLCDQDRKTSSLKNTSRAGFFGNLAAKTIQRIFAGVIVTAAAMIGTFPLLLFHFNRISLVAPLTNLLVEPLICFWSLVIGITACTFMPLSPDAAMFLLKAGSLGLILAEKICSYSASIPYASLWLPTPSIFEIIIFYLFILGVITSFHGKHERRKYLIIVPVLSFCCFLAVPTVSNMNRIISTATAVSILDVGHGDATLVQLPGNRNILIDGGGAENDEFDIGERVIGPFLWKKQLRRLDGVVITHPHADHYNGLTFILKHFHPEELWINGMAGHEPQYRQLLDLAERLDINIKVPMDNKVLLQSGKSNLRCISGGVQFRKTPGKTLLFKTSAETDINDTSLVLRLDTPDTSFLFPADISAIKAVALATEGKNLRADVLLAPHHGSRTSMNMDFITAVDPKYIVISVGRNNPFDLPGTSFQTLKKKGIHFYTTRRDGTLTFTARDGKLILQHYQVN